MLQSGAQAAGSVREQLPGSSASGWSAIFPPRFSDSGRCGACPPSIMSGNSLAGCSCHSSTLKILSSSCFVTALFKRNIKATYKLKFSNITVKIGEVNFNNTLLFNLKDRKQYFNICMFLFKKLLMRLSWPSKTAGSSPVDSTHGSKMLGGTVGWGTVPCSRKAVGERRADQEGALRSPPAHCLLPTPLCPNPMGSHPASLPV